MSFKNSILKNRILFLKLTQWNKISSYTKTNKYPLYVHCFDKNKREKKKIVYHSRFSLISPWTNHSSLSLIQLSWNSRAHTLWDHWSMYGLCLQSPSLLVEILYEDAYHLDYSRRKLCNSETNHRKTTFNERGIMVILINAIFKPDF